MASTTVNFNLKNAGYANFANQTLTFTLLTAGANGTGDFVVLPGTVTATSDANGDGSVTLFQNGVSNIESVYEVVFPNKERAKFIIPSGTTTVELSALLVNNVPSGAATQQSSVFDAAIQRANHTGTQTLSTISDAGTIASQNSNSVSITGGSISGVTLTASTANLTDSSDKRFMTDAQETKLDSISTNATETSTANVTSAGALMDSELADLSGVKTLQLPDSTTISDFAKTFLDDADAATVKTTLGITSFAQTILDDADAAAVKTTLGITDAAQVNFVPRSIIFDDENAFLSIADDSSIDVGTGDFSLAFWARLDSSSTEGVLQKNGSAGFAVSFISGNLTLTLNDSGGSSNFTLASSLNDNKWHVYVITVDRSGNAIAYVDNVAQTGVSVSGKSGNLDNTSAFEIGKVGTDGNAGVSLGNYVALYKSVLSASNAGKIYFSRDAVKTAASPALAVDLRTETQTFKDVASGPLTVTSNGSITFNEDRITALDSIPIGATTPAAVTGTTVTGTNVLATSTLGYTTGSGGTVAQGSNKGTAVTLNKATGQITLDDAALAANTGVTFTFTNSTIAANDILVFNHVSGGTIGAYNFNAVASSGSAVVTVRNLTSGELAEAPVISFAVIKAVTS